MAQRSVAVFCGSKFGNQTVWTDAAAALGAGLGQAGIRLIYGGGRVGLMGVVADAALAAGGEVLGVIPEFLAAYEISHPNVKDLVVTANMHDRKRVMFDAADAFVMLPGAVGTFDETIEVITWRQLKLHDKPILIANIRGALDGFLALLEGAMAQGFMAPENRKLYEVFEDVPGVMARLGSVAVGGFAEGERT